MKLTRPLVCVALGLMMISFAGCAGDGGDTEGAPSATSTPTSNTTSSARPGSATDTTGDRSSVVAGIVEPDANYPWVVHMNGCGGVLIDPQWVLTAAHCVTPGIGVSKITYKRTDPQTGAESAEEIPFNRNVGPTNNRGVFTHPEYKASANHANDIALIALARPFAIQPLLQTVGLPKGPLVAGVVGNLANLAHDVALPSGKVAVFRAPMPAALAGTYFIIEAAAAKSFLCPGDSGSGFVTVEDGRATVRGVASKISTPSDCKSFNDLAQADFTDVFKFHEWILETMRPHRADLLTVNARVRWSGAAAYGRMEISCPVGNSGSQAGPLNVRGAEVGITCSAGQLHTAACALDPNQGPGPIYPVLSSITVRTSMEDGTTVVQSRKARTNTVRLHARLPSGAVSREYTCEIGTRRGRIRGPAETVTVKG